MGELVLLAVSVVLILLCGLFVAAEFSFITVDRTKVRRAAQKGDRKAIGLQHALKRLSTQLSGAQVGITITNLAIGYLAQPSLARMLGAPLHALGISGAGATGVSVIVALILATAATMIFGELVPKNLAIAMPMQTARSVQGFQRGFS